MLQIIYLNELIHTVIALDWVKKVKLVINYEDIFIIIEKH